MVEYEAPLRDCEFLFNEVFDVTPTMEKLGYDFDEDFLSMLAEGWAHHAKEIWLPIFQLGDRVGLKFENAKVPHQEFKDAQSITGRGWLSILKPEHEAWELQYSSNLLFGGR